MLLIKLLLGIASFFLTFVSICVFFLDFHPQSRMSYIIRKYISKDLE
jgi:hypothetical protein